MLEADYDRLQALFSQCLNTPSGGAVDFWPVGLPGLCYVMLNFVDMQRESSREANLGWVTEKECYELNSCNVSIYKKNSNRKTRLQGILVRLAPDGLSPLLLQFLEAAPRPVAEAIKRLDPTLYL